MKLHIGNRTHTLLIIITLPILVFFPCVNVHAMSAEQRKILNYNINYYNECSTYSVSSGDSDITAGSASTNSVESWVEKYGQWAFDDGKAYGVPYEVILAQGAFESGWGSSYNAKHLHNFFGITRTSSQPGEGRWYGWENDRAGWRGYVEYITSSGYYEDALNNYAHDPYGFLKSILDIYAPESDGNAGYYENASGIMTSIIEYIDENDLFPPSSEVEYDTVRPQGNSMSSNVGVGDACVESSGGGATEYADDGAIIYAQCDDQWSDASFGSSTVCEAGCGPSSLAMIITALTGKTVTPPDVASYVGERGGYVPKAGSSHDVPIIAAGNSAWGIRAEKVSKSIDSVNKILDDGGMAWMCGSGSLPFSSGGHCIGVRARTESGKWLTFDSSQGSKGHDSNKEYDPSTIINQANDSVHGVYAK